ncbi:hypothetical protein HanPI659440_Chr03g0119171 [Helianthus annuus]|nr:hypothetical protein HanPI659440_Chr03g0119171 [Helianthus annuus]
MGWQWKEQHLDLILVPLGFSIMCIYHIFLLHIYNKRHTLTAIGYENDNKEAWVEKMLQAVLYKPLTCRSCMSYKPRFRGKKRSYKPYYCH